jgi:hypothetical protein
MATTSKAGMEYRHTYILPQDSHSIEDLTYQFTLQTLKCPSLSKIQANSYDFLPLCFTKALAMNFQSTKGLFSTVVRPWMQLQNAHK